MWGGHSVLIYQHFPREAREQFIPSLIADLKQTTNGATVEVFKAGHVAFLLVKQAHHQVRINSAAATTGWPANFMSLVQLPD